MISLPSARARTQPLGLILYQGPSLLDGAAIVAIATGLRNPSRNEKTGDMVQTWILRQDIAPTEAINTGADVSVCGSCPLRGTLAEGRNRHRACYVQVRNAPYQVWQAYQAGSYVPHEPREHDQLLRGRKLRLGAYGDPCAVPFQIWQRLIHLAAGHTGYTHTWEGRGFSRHRSILMASCETLEQAQTARAQGWRTFRTLSHAGDLVRGEVLCPASAEAGKRTQCAKCLACNGNGNGRGAHPSRVSIAIVVHGSPAVIRSYSRLTDG